LLSQARSARKQGMYREAVASALLSCAHIDGMIQFQRKYGQAEVTTIESLDLVLALAPLLFDFQSLDKVEVLLKEQRRIERNSSVDWNASLSAARAVLIAACHLWDLLSKQPDSLPDDIRGTIGIDRKHWKALIEAWETMGLLSQVTQGDSVRLSLATEMNRPTRAKCPSCGTVAKAAKAKFLEDVVCPRCNARVVFVLLLPEHGYN